MCGIVGYIGTQDAVPVLIDCLKRLEYRGYDSAGLSVIHNGRLEVRRRSGKIARLEQELAKDPPHSRIGIAHTRWATHGRPSDGNAHPHTDCTHTLAVVHNGIIENYLPLKAALRAEGHAFTSETDTEVIAHLIERTLNGDLGAATRRAVSDLRGAFALGILSQSDPERLVALRNGGPPLVVGKAKGGVFVASDIAAILAYTRDVLVLEDGEMAILSPGGVRVVRLDGSTVDRTTVRIPWDAAAAEKQGYPHFMLKEIHEQPKVIEDTLRGRVDFETGEVGVPDLGLDPEDFERVERVLITACGTSWHAGLVGKHLLEATCRLPVEVDISSELRYRDPIADDRTLTIAISQSGETADTIGAAREARNRRSKILAICNAVGSSMTRESDGVLLTRAGPEIGVASTKSFTAQLAALILFALHLGQIRRTLSRDLVRSLARELRELSVLMKALLDREARVKELAARFAACANFLYLGRGIHHPLALEGALKLKEISYIHAEGYAAGEMKHGPIALIDRSMPVVVIAPVGRLHEKTLANIEEVRARDGVVIALATDGDERIADVADHVLRVPAASEFLLPVLVALPLQLLAYHIAVLRRRDVDQPRNLAKSVTVE